MSLLTFYKLKEVNAPTSEYILFEDSFDDMNNVYADTYAPEVYVSGGALINNETALKVFGFHPVPQSYVEIHLTITYEVLQSCSYFIVFESGGDRRTRWDYGADATTKTLGIAMNLYEGGWNDEFTVYSSYNGSFNNHYNNAALHIEQYDLNLTVYFDGINHKQSVWLNTSLVVDNLNFYNYEPYAVNSSEITLPTLVFNSIRFHRSGSVSSPFQLLEIDSIKQYVFSDEKVNVVAGKFVGLGFDAAYDSVLSDAYPLIEANDGLANFFADEYYQNGVAAALTYAQVQSMVENYGWEMGIHYYRELGDFADYETIMDEEYAWIYGNTTYEPVVFSVMQGNSNWSHASYGFTDLDMIAREWHVPTAQGLCADNIATFIGGDTAPTDYGYSIHQNSLDKNLRSWFTWTHKVISTPSVNDVDLEWFTTFTQELAANNYIYLPQRKGYNSLISTATFNILVDITTEIRFTVSASQDLLYVWVNKPSASGGWAVTDHEGNSVEIKEDLTNHLGFWVENSKTYKVTNQEEPTYANNLAGADGNVIMYGGIQLKPNTIHTYIPQYNGRIRNITLYSGTLGLSKNEYAYNIACSTNDNVTISLFQWFYRDTTQFRPLSEDESSLSFTVNSRNRGEPEGVSGVSSWSYNEDTTIVSLTTGNYSLVTIRWLDMGTTQLLWYMDRIPMFLGIGGMLMILLALPGLVYFGKQDEWQTACVWGLMCFVIGMGLIIGWLW